MKEELEKYIKTLKIEKDNKYLIFIDKACGLRDTDYIALKEKRADITFVIVRGNPNDLIKEIETK